MCGLWVNGQWDNTIVLKDVDNHVPLTSVTDEVVRKEVNQSVIKRKFCVLNGKLKVIVALVELIIEEQV
jgi:hypothetical protein